MGPPSSSDGGGVGGGGVVPRKLEGGPLTGGTRPQGDNPAGTRFGATMFTFGCCTVVTFDTAASSGLGIGMRSFANSTERGKLSQSSAK